ncbi:MAG TPA: hypothetical protein VEU47_08325 [Candidatus Cybelea sp.]|nr:hypothetical protein [Candidatus Cybelea sp.]
MSKQRAMLKTLMAKALQGDLRAVAKLVDLTLRLIAETDANATTAELAAEDQALIARYEARLRDRLNVTQEPKP